MGDLDFLGSVGLGVVNSGLSWLGSEVQSSAGRRNLDYAMDRYYSPMAQVRNLAAAGLNPAVAMGNQSPVFSGSAPMTMPDAPHFGIGTSSLSDIGNYIKSLADAKKAGADTTKALAETDAIKLQNDLTQQFGQKSWILDLAQKYQNVILAQKTNDIKEQEKAINEYKKTSEKILSETHGIEKSMLEKRLGNIDTEIRLSNKLQEEKINTEKSGQAANYASARSSNAQASLAKSREDAQNILNEIHGSPEGKQAILDELEQRARTLKTQGELNDASRDYLSKLAVLIEKDADWYEWNQVLNSAGRISGIVFDGIDRFTKLGILKNASRPDLEATEQVRFDKDGNYIGHTETKRVRSKQ